MRIKVGYFALLREQAGKSEEEVTTEAGNASALYEELGKRHGFTIPAARVRMVINQNFMSPETMLHEGDHVVFVLPVSGG